MESATEEKYCKEGEEEGEEEVCGVNCNENRAFTLMNHLKVILWIFASLIFA